MVVVGNMTSREEVHVHSAPSNQGGQYDTDSITLSFDSISIGT